MWSLLCGPSTSRILTASLRANLLQTHCSDRKWPTCLARAFFHPWSSPCRLDLCNFSTLHSHHICRLSIRLCSSRNYLCCNTIFLYHAWPRYTNLPCSKGFHYSRHALHHIHDKVRSELNPCRKIHRAICIFLYLWLEDWATGLFHLPLLYLRTL